MTLMFRPTPEQQASLPLGSNFEMTLSGVVQNSTVQVSLLLMSRMLSLACVPCERCRNASLDHQEHHSPAGCGCSAPRGPHWVFCWSCITHHCVLCTRKHS